MNVSEETLRALLAEQLEPIREELRRLSHARKQQHPDDTALYGVPQAAAYLGVAKQTLYNAASRGDLASVKRGKRCYFYKGDLDRWQEGRQTVKQTLASRADTLILKLETT